MYKAVAELLALMTVYNISCHDRGHINVMLVLQSCTDSLHILPGLSSVTYAKSCNISNVKFEKDIALKEEGFVAVNEEVDIKEEIPEDITFPDKNTEPDEVSYMCICLLLDTFYEGQAMSFVVMTSIFLAT
jgi:hypothetical protein